MGPWGPAEVRPAPYPGQVLPALPLRLRGHVLGLVRLIGLVVALLTLGIGAGAAAAEPAHTRFGEEASDRVVLVGTGGIIWSDVSAAATPNLWRVLREGSGAAMTIRSVNPTTCPVDAWLGLSAGSRAAAPAPDGNPRRASFAQCPDPTPVIDNRVGAWDDYVRAADQLLFNSRLGTLGDAAYDQGECISAVGLGAAIGAARSDGSVDRAVAFAPEELPGALTGCAITLVDVGSLSQTLEGTGRSDRLAVLDERIGEVLAVVPADATIIVVSMSDDGRQSRLRMALMSGPEFGPGTLLSPNTRQPGLIVNSDLTTTLLGASGLEIPRGINGSVLTSQPAPSGTPELDAQRLQDFVDYDQASFKIRTLVPIFFQTFILGQLVIYLLVLLVWKGKLGSTATRGRWLGAVRIVAVTAAAVPASTFLANMIPWWRSNSPLLAIVAAVALWTFLIALLALRGPRGRTGLGPVVVVSLVTVLVIGVDVMTGSRLQLSSLMGQQPAVGGRYFGMGNVPFALFVTSAIFFATVVANRFLRRGEPRAAAIAVGLILTGALVVNGAPMWGADAGGPLSLPAAIAFFVLTLLGIKVTWKKWLALLVGAGALFLSVAFLDSLRPVEKQSHLGQFAESLLAGHAPQIILRKALDNWNVLTSNYSAAILVPFALAFIIYVLARETSWGSRALQRSFDRYPALRPGLLTMLVALTIGFFVNDSGVAIPAVGATIAVPLLIAINVYVLRAEIIDAELADDS